MKTINRILMLDGNSAAWVDDWGKRKSTPEIAIGTRVKLRLDLRSPIANEADGKLLPVNYNDVLCDNYYFALDNDYDPATAPKLLKTSGLVLSETDGHVYLDFEMPPTASLPGLTAAVGTKGSVELKGEFGGYMADGSTADAAYAVGFPIIIGNRVYIEGEVPPYVEEDPEYLTAIQIMAIINNLTIPEKGDDGLTAYQVAVANGYTGTVEQWLASLEGQDGKSTYQLAVDVGFGGTVEQWLATLKGDKGDPGLTAYQLATANGYQGTVNQWLDDLKGLPGAPGQDLHFDATGELTELDAYNDQQQGFTFASAIIDPETNVTTLYVYVKRSADIGDWCEPLAIRFRNGIDGANAALIPPVEFGARPAGTTYFAFAQADYPAAWISAVVIDTATDGEVQLPYNSIAGVTKITKKANKFYINFGSGCPAFTSGRAYFAQGVTTLEYEPPVDPPEGIVYYGYIPSAVADPVFKVSEITLGMLTNVGSSITTAGIATLDKTTLGVVPAGALVVVVIPSASELVATKFDGIAGKVPFELNNGANGTGANGTAITLDGVAYKIYGEFKLSDAELFVYID